ncbi:MAG: tetratricopeptide repeat protein, partial [Sedimentisphaerales bacterium]|nr:tetratricopeptide repeat protein [Sedimentisphaerales bacterium]
MKKTNPKKKSKTEKLNKKVSFAAFVLSMAFIAMIWIVYSLFSNWKNALYIPGIPDLSNQPEVLQNYIQEMHSAALEDPGSDRSVGRLGMVFHANFFYEEAEQCYLRAVQLNHTEWRWLYNMALISEELGDVQSTMVNLKKVVEMNPAIGQAWFRLGTACLKQNAYEDALYAFQTVLAKEPFTVSATSNIPLSNKGAFPLKAYASLNIGRTEFEQGKHDEARRTLTALITSHPTFGSAYRLLGQVFLALGDQDKADYYVLRAGDFESYIPPPDAIYDDLILYSRKPDFLIKQFQIAVRSQNTDWAFALNRLLMECKPESKDIVTELLKFSVDLQQKEAVAAYGDRFSKLFRSDENRLLEMTRFLILREEYDPALLLIKQIRAVNPGSVGAHLEYVSILRNRKEYEKAEAYCNNLITTVPHNPYIKIGLARVLIEQGKYNEAAEQLSLAAKINPGIDAG